MHPEVDWPNAWEGGRVVGHAAVRDYWRMESPRGQQYPRCVGLVGGDRVFTPRS
jgi:hypothetical protein